MPRSIWRGVLSFGMVAIPVRLYLATESSSKVSFNLLCPEHKSRIKNKRWCAEGDRHQRLRREARHPRGALHPVRVLPRAGEGRGEAVCAAQEDAREDGPR